MNSDQKVSAANQLGSGTNSTSADFDSKCYSISVTKQLKYRLEVIQQPERARASGVGSKADLDRRTVDPPPILRLRISEVDDKSGNGEREVTMLRLANLFALVTLKDTSPDEFDTLSDAISPAPTPSLAGSKVSSISYFQRPRPAGYFIFPDLAVRHEGVYQLDFHLYEQAPSVLDGNGHAIYGDGQMASFEYRQHVQSIPFTVYSAKKFPGLGPSTPLSQLMSDQGSRIRIRRDMREVHRRPKSDCIARPNSRRIVPKHSKIASCVEDDQPGSAVDNSPATDHTKKSKTRPLKNLKDKSCKECPSKAQNVSFLPQRSASSSGQLSPMSGSVSTSTSGRASISSVTPTSSLMDSTIHPESRPSQSNEEIEGHTKRHNLGSSGDNDKFSKAASSSNVSRIDEKMVNSHVNAGEFRFVPRPPQFGSFQGRPVPTATHHVTPCINPSSSPSMPNSNQTGSMMQPLPNRSDSYSPYYHLSDTSRDRWQTQHVNPLGKIHNNSSCNSSSQIHHPIHNREDQRTPVPINFRSSWPVHPISLTVLPAVMPPTTTIPSTPQIEQHNQLASPHNQSWKEYGPSTVREENIAAPSPQNYSRPENLDDGLVSDLVFRRPQMMA